MKAIQSFKIVLLCLLFAGLTGNGALAQETDTIRMQKLELKKRAKQVFDSRDSILVLQIDTLIMKDRSSLQFFGKKKVILLVNHADIGKRVYFSGRSNQNNASDMDISIKFEKLGSLFIMADGYDANNGSRTDPNGDGGNVRLVYSNDGIQPQQQQSKKPNFLHFSISGGGKHVNPTADVQRILNQARRSGGRMGGLPQGQVYSGSAGRDGKSEISGRPGEPKSW